MIIQNELEKKVESKTGMRCSIIHLATNWAELIGEPLGLVYGAADCYMNGICIGNVGFFLMVDGSIKLTQWNYNE